MKDRNLDNYHNYRYTLIFITIPFQDPDDLSIRLTIQHDNQKDLIVSSDELKNIIIEIISLMQNYLPYFHYYNWQIKAVIERIKEQGSHWKEALIYWKEKKNIEHAKYLQYKMTRL